jgi:hypothetical protein
MTLVKKVWAATAAGVRRRREGIAWRIMWRMA